MPLDFKETTADWLACQCGNIPISDGFYACLEDGRTVEPDADGLWGGALYLCAGCYSIYNIYTFEDLGKASDIAIQMFNMGITQ
jgi:hypothetical protein